jgi:signal peptidase I
MASVPLIYLFGFCGMRFFLVPSKSMEPGILPNDRIITLSKDSYERGDIVVINDPFAPEEYLVKRIVGLPGDTLEVKGGALFINNHYASEPYRYEFIDYIMEPYRVKSGEIFVLGDHSNWSVDSHNWSASPDDTEVNRKAKPAGVRAESIIGQVKFCYWPFARVQSMRAYPLTNIQGD